MKKSTHYLFIFTLFIIAATIALPAYPQTKTKPQTVVKKIEQQDNRLEEDDDEDVDELIDELELGSPDSVMLGIGGDELIPASDIYSIWSNVEVNPYKQEPILDTIPISLLGYHFPLKIFYRVNSEFGQRRRRYHYGIDLKIERGDTVVSSFGGMVRMTKDYKKKGYGKVVIVRHFNGLETFYAHLDEILVEPDQMVTSGEMIGLAGNTGRSSGPHLHYELRYQGRPINPRDIVDFDSTLYVKNDTLQLTAQHFVYPKKSSKVKTTTTKNATAATKTAATAKNTAAANIASKGVWKVKSGDTLGHIAEKTGTSITNLCKLNGVTRKTVLQLGQKIKY